MWKYYIQLNPTIFDNIWQFLTKFDLSHNIGIYLAIYQYLTTFDKDGHYSKEFENNWQYLGISVNIGQYLSMLDKSWKYLSILDNIYKYLTELLLIQQFDWECTAFTLSWYYLSIWLTRTSSKGAFAPKKV